MEPVAVNTERLVDTFVDLCRQNTPPQARSASQIAHGILLDLEFDCAYDDAGGKVGGNIGNLIAFKKGSVSGAPPIFFSSHFDTVEPTPGLEPIIEGDIVRSDGKTILGADDKCGVGAILEAMRIIVEQRIPHGDIQLLLTICERDWPGRRRRGVRIQSDSSEVRLCSGQRTAYRLVRLYRADTGHIRGLDSRHGKASHAGAQPEEGISAIAVAARAIARMKLGQIDPETTANVGIVQGGVATNVIPEECYLKCEGAVGAAAVGQTASHMDCQLIREEAEAVGAMVDVKNETVYQRYELGMDDAVLTIGLATAERIGLETHLRVSGGGSDGNIFNAMGFPTTVVGCGMMNIHRHDEYVRISDMVKSAQLVVSIVETAAASQD